MSEHQNGLFDPLFDRKQLRFVIFVAVLYAVLLVPFKPLVVVPGFTEVRPANFVPALFGVMFGPAAAWGSAFGNLAADAGGMLLGKGTLTLGSIFGFIGNFLFAYAAWRVWILLMEKGAAIDLKRLVYFNVAGLVGSVACAVVIGAGVFALGLQNWGAALFMVMFITVNNFLSVLVLGSIGLWLAYAQVKEK
ncbi:MAG: QueT transporter family protein, partial [Candidatus Micrarchaeota archaeon]|nr:QueT transporter family protein [Candidatus Micrarchaeota archaeon]